VKVTVRSIALIKSLLGQGELQVELPAGTTVDDLLGHLAAARGSELAAHLAKPAEASAHAPLRVMVNGRDIAALADRQTVLEDGDDVLVFTPIAGG
jgi:molybdopterin synthase sulfur carrier subunit